jgi:hypothetical protein
MQQRHNHKRGFNLIEAAIILGVVGLVIGGIWVGAAKVKESLAINEMAGAFPLICSNAASLFPLYGVTIDSTEDITNTAISAGVFPNDWIRNGLLELPIGQAEKLMQWNMTRGTDSGKISFYMHLNRTSCVQLGQKVINLAGDGRSFIVSLRVTPWPNAGGSGTYVDFPTSEKTIDCPYETNRFQILCRPNNR